MLRQIFFKTIKTFTWSKLILKKIMEIVEESDVYKFQQAQINLRSDCFPIIFSLSKKLLILAKRHRAL